jgi:hypothetical protein
VKGVLAIAAREIREHRLFLLAALLLGLFPPLFAWLVPAGSIPERLVMRDAPQPQAWEVTLVLGTALGGLFALGLAVSLGASVVARDLTERRLGFYLARPVSPLAVWAGKMLAAVAVPLAAFALALLLPLATTAFLGRGIADFDVTGSALARLFAFFAAMVAVVVLVTALLAGLLRVATPLLALDVALFAAWAGAVVLITDQLFAAGAFTVAMTYAFPGFWLAVLAVFLAAGAAQVVAGRVDVVRGRRALSATLWGGLSLCVAGLVLFGRFVASATPADIVLWGASVEAPSNGERVLLRGPSRRWTTGHNHLYRPTFVVEADGRHVPLGGDVVGVFSSDGRRLAWAQEGLLSGRVNVYDVEVGTHAASLGWPSRPPQTQSSVLAVSPTGRRLLVLRGESLVSRALEVLDSETGSVMATLEDARDPSARVHAARFVSETTVEWLAVGPATAGSQQPAEGCSLREWDLASSHAATRSSFALARRPDWEDRGSECRPSPDWSRVLLLDASGLRLHDAGGAHLGTLVSSWTSQDQLAGWLSDSRIWTVEGQAAGLALGVFGPDGRPALAVRVAGRFPVQVGAEVTPGQLALAPSSDSAAGSETVFVDLETGSVKRRERGVRPALYGGWRMGDAPVAPGSFASRLFLTDERALVSIDPATWRRRTIVQGQRLGD